MRKAVMVLVAVTVCAVLAGCAVTIPTGSYIPQNYVRYDNPTPVDISQFAYLPLVEGKVKLANQIRNTAAGSIHVSGDVSEFVRRVNALELEKTGIQLTDKSNIQLSGDIVEFYVDDLGYSATIHYTIKYIIKNSATGEILYSNVFTPEPLKAGKFGTPAELVQVLNGQVASTYDMFIKDSKVMDILNSGEKTVDSQVAPEKKQSSRKK